MKLVSLLGAVGLTAALVMSGCKGEVGPAGSAGPVGAAGADGAAGAAGAAGADGAAGAKGDPGVDAVTLGTITGTVADSSGTVLAGVSVTTVPTSTAMATDASGAFTLADIPIGAYDVVATKVGYADYTLTGVGVAAGSTTSVSLAMGTDPAALGTIQGTVLDALEAGIAGVVVTVKGQTSSATTDASGAFTLTDVTPGFVYLFATAPTGYMDGETHDGLYVASGSILGSVAMHLSGRPSASATFVGEASCQNATCHGNQTTQLHSAAHYRSITNDSSRMMYTGSTNYWPAVGGTTVTGIQGLDPVTGTGMLDIMMCQPTAGNYAMKFGGTANCADAATGFMVPVSGTYGGEGDGGIDNRPNFGSWKQRFLVKPSDVPAASWDTYSANGKQDWLILPVQITQSGTDSSGAKQPHLGGYHGSNWCTQGRAFSKKCAGCHNTGLAISWDANNNITAYDFKDRNITCERCHGPGSEHIAAPIATRKLNIIIPSYLTAEGERGVCGQCHAADAGSSMVPSGGFGYAWNSDNAGALGGGVFVPGAYDLTDYIKGYGVSSEQGGGFHSWPDEVHGLAHRQQMPMLEFSVHANNPYEQLTCTSCHNPHSLFQGPEKMVEESGTDSLTVMSPTYKDNTLCLTCHATHGPWADLTKLEIEQAFVDNGGSVNLNGNPMTVTAEEATLAKRAIAKAVSAHMDTEVGMGMAPYNPLNDDEPVGRCTSCHMAKTAKSGGYTMGVDADGNSAIVEADQGSHTFQVVWPWESAVLKKASGGKDTDIMPNACGKCHRGARLSGD